MSLRRANIRVPALAGSVRGADIEEFAQRARRDPFAEATLVSVTFAASGSAKVRHTLGRRYVGAVVIGQSAQHTQSISAVDPTTFQNAGNDASVYLGVAAGGTYTGTVYLMVF
jgi:hypothetical protein